MRKIGEVFQALFLCVLISTNMNVAAANKAGDADSSNKYRGAFYTGKYPNLFAEVLHKGNAEVSARIDSVYQQLFYGDDATQRIYYPVGTDMAYIEDILNKDVRTEGMSYGLMITVQLNKKMEFDRLWKWAKVHMQHQSGKRAGYFAWHCKPTGEVIDSNSASDGEEWFATALLLASGRWGNGQGIFNYKAEAQIILDAMLSKLENSDSRNDVTNIFNKTRKQIVFVPSGEADDFTDPSYHVPHFYELWACWADKQNKFWADVADTSRSFLTRAVDPNTGLAPDYSTFDGKPYDFWHGGANNFRYDAWRVAANVAIDYMWFGKNDWAVLQSDRLQQFFFEQGIKTFGATYTLDGKNLIHDHSAGLISMSAVASLAASNIHRKDFLEEMWNIKTPVGTYRYYDGILYMLGLLELSGNYRIYTPGQ